ncbi:MAG TPA: sialidase family protein [Terriglobales bacterium]|jgi:hypothetical protein|nr:sialidase family protein [Terriglobales bacterium]
MANNVRLSGAQTSARSESDVRFNPNNVNQIIGASNNLSFNPQAQFYSTDGGATWSQTNLPAVTGDSNQSDPCVDWTGDGTAWALTVGVGASNVVRSFKSTDGGATWTYDSVVSGTQTNVDKPNLWVDHSPTSLHQDNMYALWWNSGPTYVARRAGPVGAWQTPVQVSGSETTGGSDGGDIKTNSFGDVFAFWPSESDRKLFVVKSTDGGVTFGALGSAPVKIADTFSSFLYHVPSDEPSRGTLLYITGGAYRTAAVDMVYAIWMDLAGGSGCNSTANMPGTNVSSTCKTRIWFSRSSDGGATWSSPVKINDQAALNDQFFPRLAVDADTGAMMLVYYDTINDPGRKKTDIWMQTSLDHGATWSGPTQVTSQESDETVSGYNTYQYGDYIGLACQSGRFFACWTDRRSGSFEEIWGAPLGVASMEFKIEKDTYGQDEVAVHASWPSAFWLAIDGFSNTSLGFNSPSDLNSPPNPPPVITVSIDAGSNPTLSAAQIATIAANLPTIAFGPSPILATDPTLALDLQMFFYPYTVSFPNNNAFGALNLHQFAYVTLSASFTVGQVTLTTQANIELTKAEDPYLYNYNPANPQAYPSWLSFDLRVFSVTPSQAHQMFSVPNPANASDAVPYIRSVLNNLNNPSQITNGGTFDNALTQSEEQSSLGFLQNDGVFNFAVARVRILAHTVTTVNNVRVFFRLFQAASTVSTFAEVGTGQGTYRWGTNGTPGHKIPLLGVQTDQNGNLEYVTVPCFASDRVNLTTQADMNTQTDTPNVWNINTIVDTEVDTYFGCWIDNNQSTNFLPAGVPAAQSQWDGPWPGAQSLNGLVVAAPHQCLIAEIRFDDAPTPPGGNTATSDKLAQRNIAWIDGPNPGTDPSRVMPHPFEIRSTVSSKQPDELMITWGRTPHRSIASIYLPAVQASEIITLANLMYPAHNLSIVDAHTIQCPTGDATLVPVPKGVGRYAGLLSIDLHPGIRRGEVYNIAVRQLNVVTAVINVPPPPPKLTVVRAAAAPTESFSWRQVAGAFQFTITISTKSQLLLPEERLLAWLKWRLEVLPHSSRWYPVLKRYLHLIEGRVSGLGGNPGVIHPSPNGTVPGLPHPHPGHRPHPREHCFGITGKVVGICYDRFGDFEGFMLLSEEGHEHTFFSREHEIEELVRKAWLDRMVITVFGERHDPDRPASIVLRRAPNAGKH